MKGFDERFADFPAYILGLTHHIWKERAFGPGVRAYYHPDVISRTPGALRFGRSAVAAELMALSHEFPDGAPMSEDVIWSGTPERGMLASQRCVFAATHSTSGAFAPATGRRITARMMAECYAKDNKISDEWRVWDTGAIVRQLGYGVKDWAQARLSTRDPDTQPFRPALDVQGPYTGRGNDNEWGVAFAAILSQMMEGAFSVIPEQYDGAVQADYPGGHTTHGPGGAEAFWLGLRAAFPSALFQIHHQIGMDDPNMSPRAALRWSLTGTHDGWGLFGAPTGAEIHVMGISHAEFGPRGLRREWTLFDEPAIWIQILAHQGS